MMPFAANPEKWKAAIRYAPVEYWAQRRRRSESRRSWYEFCDLYGGGFCHYPDMYAKTLGAL
jgi:hypothetical protein